MEISIVKGSSISIEGPITGDHVHVLAHHRGRPRAAPRVQGAALVLLNWGAKLRGPNLITFGNQP